MQLIQLSAVCRQHNRLLVIVESHPTGTGLSGTGGSVRAPDPPISMELIERVTRRHDRDGLAVVVEFVPARARIARARTTQPLPYRAHVGRLIMPARVLSDPAVVRVGQRAVRVILPLQCTVTDLLRGREMRCVERGLRRRKNHPQG